MAAPSVTLHFEGRPLTCRTGQTIAAALWDHGVKVLSHSAKYGRPRGYTCGRGQCMSCLMRVDGVPNVRVCVTPVADGMRVERQDAGTAYAKPMQAGLNMAGGALPVGFYYKWFTKPAVVTKLFLDTIRPMTGVGRLPDPATWTAAAAEPAARDLGVVDVLVVGAGPAGIAQALQSEGRVLVVDDAPRCGGSRRAALDRVAERCADVIAGLPRLIRLREALEDRCRRLDAADHVDLRRETTVVGCYQPDMLLLRDTGGLAFVRARRVVWAAGAWDRRPNFSDADLPGVVGPRGLYRFLNADGADVRGKAALVCGRGIDLWLSAALLHAAGATVSLAPARGMNPDGDALATAQRLGWQLHTDMEPVRAAGRDGGLARITLEGGVGNARTVVPCELAVVCAPALPVHDGPYQLGLDQVLDPSRGGYVPRGVEGPVWTGRTAAGLTLTVAGEAAGATPEASLLEVTP